MKTIIGHRPTLWATLLLLFLPFAAMAQSSDEEPHISITGRAEREVTPDDFWLSITLSEEDSKGRETLEEQQRRMVEGLQNIGIDTEKELRLKENSSDYFRRGQSLASARFELRLHSPQQLWQAFQLLSDQGLSQVALERVAFIRIEQIEQELRREAILDARTSAEELATALGQSIGPCLYIQDWNQTPQPPQLKRSVNLTSADFAEFAETGDAVAEENTALDFQAVKLSYQVQAKFRLNTH